MFIFNFIIKYELRIKSLGNDEDNLVLSFVVIFAKYKKQRSQNMKTWTQRFEVKFMLVCLSTGTVSVLLRPGTGVHRVLLNEGKKRRRRRKGNICSLPACLILRFGLVPTPLCDGRSVASVLHPYEWLKWNRLLLQCCKVSKTKGKIQTLNRRSCWRRSMGGDSFYSFTLIVQLFECQWAPVCSGPHLNV